LNYVFCGAYKALLFALYIKNLGEEITIVTYSKDVTKYCANENIKCISFPFLKLSIKSIYKLFTLKKTLDEVIEKMNVGKEDNYFLTGKVLAYESIYIAKELAKKGNKIYYKNVMRELNIFKPSGLKSIFIKGMIFKFFMKFALDLDIMYYESNEDPRLGFDEETLKKYNIIDYKPDKKTEEMILEAVKNTKSSCKGADNLIIDQGPIENLVELNSIKRIYERIFNLHIDFALKKHPLPAEENDEITISYYNIFKHCKELESYVPVELFCNNIKKNAISLFSASLITASQFEHLKAISLLELINWKHNSYKQEFKNRLIEESNNKILFPASFEELKEILLNS